jgi:protein-tyrosine phosphatase
MSSSLYWIDMPWKGRLAISSRPRGGDWLETDIENWRNARIDVVVSLLTPQEESELNLNGERVQSVAHGIRFISLPIEDRRIPASQEEVSQLIEVLREALQAGRNVAIHCRQGIGRSGMVAASLLVSSGVEPAKAVQIVSSTRGLPVPETTEQRDWIDRFSKAHGLSGTTLHSK